MGHYNSELGPGIGPRGEATTDKWAEERARELTLFQCCVSMVSPSGCTYTLSAIEMDSLRDRIAALAAEAYQAGAKSKLEEANEALRGWLRTTSREEMIQKARDEGRREAVEEAAGICGPCCCGSEWTTRGMHDPECQQPIADSIRALAAKEEK